jgi:hypothetical protein
VHASLPSSLRTHIHVHTYVCGCKCSCRTYLRSLIFRARFSAFKAFISWSDICCKEYAYVCVCVCVARHIKRYVFACCLYHLFKFDTCVFQTRILLLVHAMYCKYIHMYRTCLQKSRVCVFIYTYIYIYICTCTYIHMYVCICIYIYISQSV